MRTDRFFLFCYNTIKGKKTLAGAQFTIKYYDGFYDRNNLPARATRTWVIETKERTRSNGSKVYQAGLSDTYKVGGDNFYKVDGAITIPLFRKQKHQMDTVMI